MNIRRYWEIIIRVGYVGAPLKRLETELAKEWGCSRKTVWYYVNQLRNEGLLKYRREWKRGPIWVVPTPELRELVARLAKTWVLK